MPPLPSPGKVIRFDLHSTLGSNVNVMDHVFLSYTSSVSDADLTTLANTAATAWGTQISPNQSNQFTLNKIEGTDLGSSSGSQIVISTSKVGTSPGAYLGAGSALVIKFKIARRYRGGHPRFYMGGLLQSQLTDADTILATAANGYVTSFTAWINAIKTSPPAGLGTLGHVNISYYLGFTNRLLPSGRYITVPTPRGTPVVDPVTGYTYNPQLASQRRRNAQ